MLCRTVRIVGQHAAEPTVVDVIHAATIGFALHHFLRLTFGADKQDIATVCCCFAYNSICFVQLTQGFLQVNDVDAVALPENIPGHFGVPTAGLVTEVYAGLQQFSHGDDSHNSSPFGLDFEVQGRPDMGRAPKL